MLIPSLRTSMCLLIFIHAFRHFRWPGGPGQLSCLFRGPHQVQGHFLWPWNFIYNPQNLLYLSGRSWFQFSMRVFQNTRVFFCFTTWMPLYLLYIYRPECSMPLVLYYTRQSAAYVKYAKIFGDYFWLIFIPTEDLGDPFLVILFLLKILESGDSYLFGSLPRQCLPILTGLAGTYHWCHWFAKQHIVNDIEYRWSDFTLSIN